MRVARKVAPVSRYKTVRIQGNDLFKVNDLFPFPRLKRLKQAEVLAILKTGKRIGRPDFECRFSTTQRQEAGKFGAIAISVPKRLIKSSVARNRIKRLVRETFRVHQAAFSPLQVLVNFKSRNDGRDALSRGSLRVELQGLLDSAVIKTRDRAN
jgi:ribonuclease P protein component